MNKTSITTKQKYSTVGSHVNRKKSAATEGVSANNTAYALDFNATDQDIHNMTDLSSIDVEGRRSQAAIPPDVQPEAFDTILIDIISEQSLEQFERSILTKATTEELKNRDKAILKNLLLIGGRQRKLRKFRPQWRQDLDDLEYCYPNFSEVFSYLRSMAALAELGNGVMRIDPILLNGAPGCGKSSVVERIAEIFFGGFLRLSMASADSGSQIGGLSRTWGNSTPGKIFSTIVESSAETGHANPAFFCDELCKTPLNSGERFSTVGPLFDVLEETVARNFKDQSVDLVFDASHIGWFAATNEVQRIPAPLLQRFHVFEIAYPDPVVNMRVVHSVFARLQQADTVMQCFSLNECAVTVLANVAPRVMRRNIRQAAGLAALSGRRILKAEDFPVAPKSTSKMGFLV